MHTDRSGSQGIGTSRVGHSAGRGPVVGVPGLGEEPDRQPGDAYGEDDKAEVECGLGYEDSQRDRDGAHGVQGERRRGDCAGPEHGGDEGERAEEEQHGGHGQCDAEGAGPERLARLGGEVLEHEVDDELHPDQGGQGECVQQVRD